MPTHKSEDYKISAVKHYLDTNKTQEDICNIFKCSVRSLMRWVERYENENSIKRHNREAISYKVKKEYIKFIKDEIMKNKTITMEILLEKLNNKFKDLELTRRHLRDIVKDNYISLKLTHIRHNRSGFSLENLEPTLNKRFGESQTLFEPHVPFRCVKI